MKSTQQILLTVALMICGSPAYCINAYTAPEISADPAIQSIFEAGQKAEEAGNLDAAEKILKQAERQINLLPNRDLRQVLDVFWVLLEVYEKKGQYIPAENYAARIVNVETMLYSKNCILVAEDYKHLAYFEFLNKRYEDAKKNYLTAVQLGLPAAEDTYSFAEAAVNNNAFRKLQLITGSYAGAAECAEKLGNFAEAQSIFKIALAVCPKLGSKTLSKEVAEDMVLEDYSAFLRRNNRAAEANQADNRRERIKNTVAVQLLRQN